MLINTERFYKISFYANTFEVLVDNSFILRKYSASKFRSYLNKNLINKLLTFNHDIEHSSLVVDFFNLSLDFQQENLDMYKSEKLQNVLMFYKLKL